MDRTSLLNKNRLASQVADNTDGNPFAVRTNCLWI